jgi:hypothetical protein
MLKAKVLKRLLTIVGFASVTLSSAWAAPTLKKIELNVDSGITANDSFEYSIHLAESTDFVRINTNLASGYKDMPAVQRQVELQIEYSADGVNYATQDYHFSTAETASPSVDLHFESSSAWFLKIKITAGDPASPVATVRDIVKRADVPLNYEHIAEKTKDYSLGQPRRAATIPISLPSYAPPAGWRVISTDYSYRLDATFPESFEVKGVPNNTLSMNMYTLVNFTGMPEISCQWDQSGPRFMWCSPEIKNGIAGGAVRFSQSGYNPEVMKVDIQTSIYFYSPAESFKGYLAMLGKVTNIQAEISRVFSGASNNRFIINSIEYAPYSNPAIMLPIINMLLND